MAKRKRSGCLKWLGIGFVIIFALSFFAPSDSDESINTVRNTEVVETREETTNEDDYYESIRQEALEESVQQASIDESESISESIEESIEDDEKQENINAINEGIAEQLSESTDNMAYYIEDIQLDSTWRINANVTADVYTMNEYELEDLENLIRGITQTNYFSVTDADFMNKPTFHLSIYNNDNIVAQSSAFNPSELNWY